MPREKKSDLLEEAQERGLNVEEDDHYDDILAAVKAAREVDEEFDLDPVPEPETEPEPKPRGWSSLGVWQGPGGPG